MQYQINTKFRIKDIINYRLLKSGWMQAGLFGSMALVVVSWLILLFVADNQFTYGFCIITTSVAAGFANVWLFGQTYYPGLPVPKTIKEIKEKSVRNIGEVMTFKLLLIIGGLISNKTRNDLEAVGVTVIKSDEADRILGRLQINKEKMVEAYREFVLPDLSWPKLAEGAYKLADKLNHSYIGPEHFLGAILLNSKLRKVIRGADLREDDVLFAVWWQSEEKYLREYNKRWWEEDKILSFSGVGLSWAAGFTPFVDRFARLPRGSSWDDVLYGHEGKVDELINTLARQRQSNVLLVGDPGVGRLGIVRRLSWLIRNSRAHKALDNQRVLYMNIGELIAGGSSGASQLSLVSRALKEMEKAGNIIVIFDGLGSILGKGGEQRSNLTDILLPFLSSKNVRVVVMTSTSDYHLRLKSNEQIIQYFEVVQVASLSEEATMRRIALTVPEIEREAGLFIPYKTIRELVRDTAVIMPHIPFPERAYDFLEEAIVVAQNKGDKILKSEHVRSVISKRLGIDFGEMRANEREKLMNLEDVMHERLVNQNHAVKTLVHALVRARAQVRSVKRPIGTFLFLGPTGVGKTETAKTLAESYFGSEDQMIRFDMSEFQGSEGVGKLIGSGDHSVGRLTSMVADKPFAVLLLDEFEKASSEVHQLFLQVFDEGRLTDFAGREFSFRHTIIVATSNAGAELIRKSVKGGNVPEGFDEELKEHILSQGLMRPELLNRFDAVITYSSLSKEHIREIAKMMLTGLNKRLDAKHGVKVKITDDLLDYLVSIGYSAEFGARPMNRAIQETVEYFVAQKIVEGGIEPGQEMRVSSKMLKRE